MLLLVFMTYGCRFEEESDLSEKESQAAHPRPAPPTHLPCISHAPRSISRAFPVHLPVPPHHIPAASPRLSQELLMYSWAWSIMQRFAVNEPARAKPHLALPRRHAPYPPPHPVAPTATSRAIFGR